MRVGKQIRLPMVDNQKYSQRFIGITLVLVSAAVFSSAGLFVKGVDSNSWVIIFWRGLFAGLFTLAFVGFRGRLHDEFLKMGKAGMAAGVIGALGTVAFIPSFKFTSIANVSLIYAAAPFVSAIIAWFWMREKPTLVVILSSLVAFIGVGLIVSGSLGTFNLKGDLMALWMTVAMAIYVCIYRRYPDTPAAGPAVLLSFLLLPVGLWFGEPFAAPMYEIVIMGSFGLVFSIASVTLAEGARRLPASETALLSAMETPLAPLWAWWLFSELPSQLTFLGGGIILIAVLASQIFSPKPVPN